MLWNIIDKDTKEVIGTVVTNHSLTFDEAMKLTGFEWFSAAEAGYGDGDGWSDDNGMTIWDESVADLVCVQG